MGIMCIYIFAHSASFGTNRVKTRRCYLLLPVLLLLVQAFGLLLFWPSTRMEEIDAVRCKSESFITNLMADRHELWHLNELASHVCCTGKAYRKSQPVNLRVQDNCLLSLLPLLSVFSLLSHLLWQFLDLCFSMFLVQCVSFHSSFLFAVATFFFLIICTLLLNSSVLQLSYQFPYSLFICTLLLSSSVLQLSYQLPYYLYLTA